MMRTNRKTCLANERGSLLLISYFVIVVLLGLGAAFLVLVSNEARTAERQRLTTAAFHIAEAGIERGLYNLRMDFINASGTPSWSDGDIDGMAIGPSTSYYTVPYGSTSLNGGSYTVEYKNELGTSRGMWIRSTGTVNQASHTLEVYVRMVSLSPWDYAIFAGSGQAGNLVNGNVDIRGSVLILGEGLSAGDYAIDIGGTAEIVMNNYKTLAAALKNRLPPLPTATVNGEVVETLNSVLRVKKGLVGVSGSGSVGEPDSFGDAYKETVDGVYVTDGFGGNKGATAVYSDNGTSHGYDLGDAVSFPSLSDPYPGYASYQDYLKATGYVLSAAEASSLANITPASSFSYGDANGSISMDGSGNMTIDGIVYVDNNADIALKKSGADTTITYTGTGSLLVTGNISIEVNFLTPGGSVTFPNNIVGFMTPNDISIDAAGLDVMGLLYAENQIQVAKQTDLVGTIVSNYFDMGTNVPAIYQVPDTATALPPGLIGSGSMWYAVVAWIKS